MFRPTDVIFAPTSMCNLKCDHCDTARSSSALPVKAARRFLSECSGLGIKRIGFSGGEPFLSQDFLRVITREAVRLGLLFGRIMTNGVWWASVRKLRVSLKDLRDAGYDGDICLSLDAFHRQDIRKAASFVEQAASIWRRPDVVSVAHVRGLRDGATADMLQSLDNELKGKGIFIKRLAVPISAGSSAEMLKDPWDGKWFRDDRCKGPGNVLFVLPDGDVKPCCGYATGREELTIGNIKRDSAGSVLKKARENKFVCAVFGRGLGALRKRLRSRGVIFPGETSDHCYFCRYILERVPRAILSGCLAALLLFSVMIQTARARDLCPSKEMRCLQSKVVRKLAVPRGYHEGLFYDGNSLWLANGENGKIWVIDMPSGSVRSEITPVADFAEAVITKGDGFFYSTEWRAKKLYKARLEGGSLLPEAEADFSPAHPAGMAWSGERFYIVTWTRGLGTKFHLVEVGGDLKVIGSSRIRGIHEPCQLAWDGKNLWVSSWYSRRIYRIDTGKGGIDAYFNSPVDLTTGIAWDGRNMWVTGTYDDVYVIAIEDKEDGR